MAKDDVTLTLSQTEVRELIQHLAEAAQEMDDDGREGAFAASPLKAIYDKARKARSA